MLKAVFIDFYGTIVHENGPIAAEVIQRVCKSGNTKSPEKVFLYWWKTFREKLKQANGPDFRLQREVALENFKDLLAHFESSEDPRALLERMEEHWCTTPPYEDAIAFINGVSIPVYFVTNSDDHYVSAAVSCAGLRPASIITSEQAHYYKPNKEIFLYALEKFGLASSEVIHIGDSLTGDVDCAKSAGIKSLWLNRKGKPVPDGIEGVKDLGEALNCLSAILPNN